MVSLEFPGLAVRFGNEPSLSSPGIKYNIDKLNLYSPGYSMIWKDPILIVMLG